MFHFKQFSVEQTGCAMKINTDGVLLGALAGANAPQSILDIGTGTGVIALMLAQKYPSAKIDAVEIDSSAAQTAESNFKNSPFFNRLTVYPLGFDDFFSNYSDKKYDLIVSNPPFYINSLKSPGAGKKLAKHTDEDFFKNLIAGISKHLTINGFIYLILPLDTAELIKCIAAETGLYITKIVSIYSYPDSAPHREIVVLSTGNKKADDEKFVIYEERGKYSIAYQNTLKDFFTVF